MNDNDKNYQPTIALVFGFYPNLDGKPKIALKNGLDQRFSIAFDTFNPETDQMYFDIEMFENIFTMVLNQMNFDNIVIAYGQQETYTFKTFAETLKLITNKENAEKNPCDSLFIYKKEKLICFVETEYYNSIGGHFPYHDAYNFAFFMNSINTVSYQNTIEQICSKHNYKIRNIEFGLPQPTTITLWQRIKRFFN